MYLKIDIKSLDKLLSQRFSKEGFLSLRDLPKPSSFKDMNRATTRIIKAIQNRKKITVIGDYDVDGVASTTILKLFFQEIDYPIDWIIPNRFKDGYGLSPNIISRISGTDLAITVDNGISATYSAQLCKEQNIELIITDHHLIPPTLPEAYAIIDQKQEDCNFPYDEVCGAQIAWYLVASLKNALNIKINMMEYLELATLAIIADMMPLTHINRAMVIAGLKQLSKSTKPAIKAFLEQKQGLSITSEDIGFFLAPILNSAGRMDDASYAVEFLSSTNIYDARVRFERLKEFNTLRKETEANITQQALISIKDSSDEVLVVSGKDWHEGVVGIVSARVSREHEKPAIILSDNTNGILKGSGRSFHNCDLFDITNSCRNLLEKFGGHESAIGLSLKKENLEEFKKQLQINYASKNYQKQTIDPEIVGELSFSSISFKLLEIIKKYEPYGMANSRPKFISTGIKIKDVKTMGKEGGHLRFLFEENNKSFVGVKFKTVEKFTINDLVSITYTINENHFRDNVSLQLIVDKIYIL